MSTQVKSKTGKAQGSTDLKRTEKALHPDLVRRFLKPSEDQPSVLAGQ